jgi:dihydrofolate reductase
VIRLIAALDACYGIADDQGIPWDVPEDRAHFRRSTAGCSVLMGYGTYVEFAEAMQGRTNYVLTSRREPLRPGFVAVHDLEDALSPAQGAPGEDLWVIGGALVFARCLPHADALVLTRIGKDFHCTKFFPPFEDAFVRRSRVAAREDVGFPVLFEEWRPVPPGT